jgi:hypothetical protein
MAKLVILSSGMTGRSHELKVDKTTIGRVDDNTFPIAESSVSSHHCEVLCAVLTWSSMISIPPTALSSTATRSRAKRF